MNFDEMQAKAIDGQFVVVSISSDGVVHVWGDENSMPYPDKEKARQRKNAFLKEDKEQHPHESRVLFKVCKVLGRPPTA